MPKMVCVSCEVELKPKENGVLVIEEASFGPYKIWYADVWKCPKCQTETVAGFGHDPLMEHYEEGFADFLEKAKSRASRIIYDKEK
jgi:hypothetical protein